MLLQIETTHGGLKIGHDGHFYNRERAFGETVYWRCEVRSCKARLHTRSGEIASVRGSHDHLAVEGRLDILKVREEMRLVARVSEEAPNNIMTRCLQSFPVESAH